MRECALNMGDYGNKDEFFESQICENLPALSGSSFDETGHTMHGSAVCKLRHRFPGSSPRHVSWVCNFRFSMVSLFLWVHSKSVVSCCIRFCSGLGRFWVSFLLCVSKIGRLLLYCLFLFLRVHSKSVVSFFVRFCSGVGRLWLYWVCLSEIFLWV